ncbi:MAG TPA: NIL domain-containing protein [Elusimicrobiota bacterium]|nr:NIL domain-containing protein [Elusimicrobiota bacterium]
MKKTFQLVYSAELIRKPVVYQMSRQFRIPFVIQQAKVTDDVGELVLEMEAEEDVLRRAAEWMVEQGVRLKPLPVCVLVAE